MTDLMLVERLRAGDADALETLMASYGSRVYRVARGITGDERDAEEVVQDVFLTVFRKIGAFESRAAIGTWIFRMTTNAALNASACSNVNEVLRIEMIDEILSRCGRRHFAPASVTKQHLLPVHGLEEVFAIRRFLDTSVRKVAFHRLPLGVC